LETVNHILAYFSGQEAAENREAGLFRAAGEDFYQFYLTDFFSSNNK
jgi:hypothetical protein